MKTGQRYLGMTFAQIGILAALALVACILIGFLGIMMMSSVPQTPQIVPTYTLQPSPTAILTSTPWPTVTPIPGWQEYAFADGQAKIWLPASYVGGDTVTSPGLIMERLKATSDDEEFINQVQQLIVSPEVSFFAFDTEYTSVIRFMFIGKETISPDLVFTIDDYLNEMVEDATVSTNRVVERQVMQLDYYPAGRLVAENKISTGDVEIYATVTIYVIQVENTFWLLTFRTGREEFGSYRSILEASANTLWISR